MGDAHSSHQAKAQGPRLIALAGPFQSGKTTLLEAILAHAGAIPRQGVVAEGTSVGDTSPEARAHQMSVELNFASIDFMNDRYTFIDLPGSVEFAHQARNILPAVDAVIVVCEADERKVAALQLVLRELEELGVPHLLFLNKIDVTTIDPRDALGILQPVSRKPLLLRQIPIWKNDAVIGFIDLALERAYVYRDGAPSEVIEIPKGEAAPEKEARYTMLERLADYDDELMEELISDIEPPPDHVFDDLTKELRASQVAPMFIGSAQRGAGVTQLLKALRHEAPGVREVRKRLGISESGPALARILRTIHTTHGGKLSITRVLRGGFDDGEVVVSINGEDRISGMAHLLGTSMSKIPHVREGDVVAFGRVDHAQTGDTLVGDARADRSALATQALAPDPVHAIALVVKDRKDEMRLAGAVLKLVDEDPSLIFVHDQEMSQLKLYGQGEMHLRVTLERLHSRFGITPDITKPSVSYRETIRHKATVRGRHKKQSGGHGQFGDVVLEIEPRGRGQGFAFAERVHGGSVPKQYFASVEAGCQDALVHGPLGFPVVDIGAVLIDGSYHSVDSSDMAFRTAARMGMSEALGKADPILLEPVLAVDILAPSEAMARVTSIVSSRRGQIMGFEPREGWEGWHKLETLIPEADMDNLIVELRSITAGVGNFRARFDHLAEVVGKQARDIAETHAAHHHARAGLG